MIRKATVNDQKEIKDLIVRVLDEVESKYYSKETLDEWKKTLDLPLGYIVYETDKIVGVGAVSNNNIMKLYVLPEYQGKGFGKALLNELEKTIMQNYKLAFLISTCNSEDFYQKQGYEYFKTIEIYENKFKVFTKTFQTLSNSS